MRELWQGIAPLSTRILAKNLFNAKGRRASDSNGKREKAEQANKKARRPELFDAHIQHFMIQSIIHDI
jgi:hypothetical protein